MDVAANLSRSADSDRAEPDESWSGVYAMALCVFALIASEFMPVSLLTPLAADLKISEGLAGQGIAVSGAVAVVTSLSISALARKVDRRALLLGLTLLMGVSGAIVGSATSVTAYLAGRALIGVVVGGFWSLMAATAMRLVPARKVPRALAICNGGNALATIVAAPLGSYLGSVLGWRGAFYSLVPVALLVLAWQWISLPPMPAQHAAVRAGGPFGLLRRRAVALGLAAAGLFFMGQFMLFTYVRPFLESVTRVQVSTLSFVLLAVGVAGFVGTLLSGAVLRLGLYRTLAIGPVLMALVAAALVSLGHSLLAAAPLLAAWGLVATAAPVGWWSWLANTLPHDAEAGGGLFVATVQLSIAMGSTLGGVLVDSHGYAPAFLSSAGMLLLAAAGVAATARADRRIANRARHVPQSVQDLEPRSADAPARAPAEHR